MFEYDGDEPLPLKEGDNIEVIDDIKRGSVICFHRKDESLIHIRTLTPQDVKNYSGPKFSVDKGSDPGLLKLTFIPEETE